ncbi:uncharacterized protein F5147DRAFT_649696 [Suillus discolor]|uniref:Fungal-type protein kinase domain-containing protein n=1 Tax=Suillus discolor TaxID=1912936 RepID=A0A9P7JY19_9AGAM|nr:uncharacterized protein F5147DRAFT_649696 [Suillus discolor]KAG2115323.1 hypothetical protein F5147DRAFT_649696 [Suillus discolor]
MTSSTTGILPMVSSSNAFPTRHLQPRMDKLLDNDLEGNVMWEETDLPAITPSLMDHLITILTLHIVDIENITYHSRVPIFTDSKWQLNKDAKKQTPKQKQALDARSDLEELKIDREGSSASVASDTSDQTSGCREYNPQNPISRLSLKQTEEQKWVHVFNSIYTAMRMKYRDTHPFCSSVFPFELQIPKCPHRHWSPEFCNTPIPDATNVQKSDIVMLNSNVQSKGWAHILTCIEITESDLSAHRDIPLFKGTTTKGYLMMREQPWCRFVVLFSLASNNLRPHYMDRSGLIITRPISVIKNLARLVDMLNTMSLANSKAYGMDPTMHMCDESCEETECDLEGKAIGWIEGKDKEKLFIISILWRSQGLFSRGTVCYCVRDQHGRDYALKDCWVEEAKRTNPRGKAHKAMVQRNVLHGDLSPNNFVIFDGHGYFIDFDHAQIIMEVNTSFRSRGTGTVPYMSIRLLYAAAAIERANGGESVVIEHTASDDLESLFYIFVDCVTTFDGLMGKQTDPKMERWGQAIEDMDADQKRGGVTHEEIEEVLNAWMSHEGADEPLPPEEVH